jgi:hypothetical protein
MTIDLSVHVYTYSQHLTVILSMLLAILDLPSYSELR